MGAPTPQGFDERAGLLFVGAFHAKQHSPNSDSVCWFSTEIWPRIRARLGAPIDFSVAGSHPPPRVRELAAEGVKVLPDVEDLAALYDRARVFVAPTRFAGGIPYKVHHAAAHGLPVVCTSLLANQLGWKHEQELLAADDAEGFAACCCRLYQDPLLWDRLRRGALARIEAECSARAFDGAVRSALAASERARAAD
jgi:glycosyltransferase involved in cell wall biosynthesis